jgi:hypothetical protein
MQTKICGMARPADSTFMHVGLHCVSSVDGVDEPGGLVGFATSVARRSRTTRQGGSRPGGARAPHIVASAEKASSAAYTLASQPGPTLGRAHQRARRRRPARPARPRPGQPRPRAPRARAWPRASAAPPPPAARTTCAARAVGRLAPCRHLHQRGAARGSGSEPAVQVCGLIASTHSGAQQVVHRFRKRGTPNSDLRNKGPTGPCDCRLRSRHGRPDD